MGERAAYTVKDSATDQERADVWVRKQWFIGDSRDDIYNLVKDIAEFLMSSHSFSDEPREIDDGTHALRHDLSGGRLAHAMIQVIDSRPFDHVTSEKPHDISNHGVFEIELVEWNIWKVNHIPVEWRSREVIEEGRPRETVKMEQKKAIARVEFESGKTLNEGMDFEWKLEEETVMEHRYEG